MSDKVARSEYFAHGASREAEVVRRRDVEHQTFRQIAAHFGVCLSRAWEIYQIANGRAGKATHRAPRKRKRKVSFGCGYTIRNIGGNSSKQA